jgi:hypothetical protein
MTTVPEQMKRDNWQLYVLARSNDPSVMIPNTRKLISNLVATAKALQDWSHNNDLVFCIQTSNNAWFAYAEDNDWGFAVAECEKVLDKIGYLMYDEAWVIMQKDSFVGRTK